MLYLQSDRDKTLHRAKARYWSKNAIIFFIPHVHSTPPLGGLRPNIAILFGNEKAGMMGLPGGEKLDDFTCLAVSIQYRRVTNGETDGRTERHLATAQSTLYISVPR